MTGRPRPVVVVGEPILHRPVAKVTDFNDELATLIQDMFATMYRADGVGLAANQIGVDLAVFVYDCPDAEDVQHRGCLVNPVLLSASAELDDAEEGCLSVPGPYAPVPRPTEVTVGGLDQAGAALEVSGTGYFARCLIHETEHLAGLLFIDHLNRRRRAKVLNRIEPYEWNAALYQP